MLSDGAMRVKNTTGRSVAVAVAGCFDLAGRILRASAESVTSAPMPQAPRVRRPSLVLPARAIVGARLRRGVTFMVLAAVMVLGMVVAGAGPASAHATLISTVPAGDEVLSSAPSQVELRFDEPVDVVEGAVRVFGPDGSRADQGRVDVDGSTLQVLIDNQGEGTYTVAWRVLSEDSHNLESSFVFHVGTRTGAAEISESDDRLAVALGTAGRLPALAGMLLLFGTAAIRLLNGAEQNVSERLRPLAIGGAAMGAFGTVLILLSSAATTSGRPVLEALRFVPDLAIDTRTGRLVAIRALVLAAAALAALSLRAWNAAAWPVLAASVAAMGLLSASGHAWTADQRTLAWVSDLGHQVAAGTWVGGAAALLVALRTTSAPSQLARRFSNAALVAAVVVAATGTASGLINTGSWDAVTSTGYGRLVGAKAAGFLVLLTFGWMNRRHLVPLVERATAPLLRSLRWEVVAAVGVLAVTAVLIDQPPGRSTVEQPFNGYETSDEVMAQLTVEPARTGTNDLHLYFYDEATGAQLPVDAVEVTAATAGIPARRLDLVPVSASHVSALGASLTTPGTWSIDVTVVRAGTPTTVTFEVPIR